MRRLVAILLAFGLSTSSIARADDSGTPAASSAPAPTAAPSATQPPPGHPPGHPPPGYPPPGYAYPPPGYYPVPYYPVPVYEPQPRWKPGEPAPDGYHVETKSNGKVIKNGVTMLVVFYLISVISGATLNETEKPAPEDNNGVEPGDWSTLYIPVAGPFLTMHNTSTKQAGWPLLLIDGLLQSTGVVMIAVGLADRKEYLERNTESKLAPKLRLQPLVGPHLAGVGVSTAF